ncbi:serine/threonine protein kinase [Kribbella sindirgiensis]|uniref:non-specific serine/threonine protein kinase n=2 Tax=Kribbella sindirgiensis TaxID=1124744 RepID=A0A4R0I406_9ACTN|nr:serine/threonine protein kinase [Kribbella sindirgiensis]
MDARTWTLRDDKMTLMAEISPDALVPRATGPVATVYLLAPPGGRTVAVKVYPQPLDRRTYNGIEVEQAKLAQLRSAPSIVRVESLDDLPDGRTALRMEFCPQALPDLVAGGPLPIGDVIVLGQILSSVLTEAHDAGLVHGGVTPANVLERSSGQPALSDFGLALRLRFPRDLMGDAAYTAPEVLREGELSEAADVYGLGAVLYLALTGRPPFPARTGEPPDGVVLRVLREPPTEVTGRDVPPALSALLQRMLAKEPDARPEAATVLGEFEALLAGAGAVPEDDLDFDDFRDELAAGRSVPLAVVEAPKKKPAKQKPDKVKPAPGKSRKPLLIGAGAAVALVAVVPVVFRPGGDDPADRVAAPPPAVSTPAPTPTAPKQATIKLNPPVDKGTSVVLTWSGPPRLTYAVIVAEQGAKQPQTTLRGEMTSLTVQVSSGLKYCFLVQGTDGVDKFESAPRAIRGATCSG